MSTTDFATWFRDRLKAQRFTYDTFAEAVRGEGYACSRQSVGQWTSGKNHPRRKLWPIMAYLLGVDLVTFMGAVMGTNMREVNRGA